MKRTFTANIDGQVFDIDEDAYTLLLNYLDQLHHTFGSDEGTEIVADMESRIREHFGERLGAGKRVIEIADVQRVITTMGRPEDLCDECTPPPFSGEPQEEVPPCAPMPEGPQQQHTQIEDWADGVIKKRLYRNMQNKVFGGVFGGLAEYLGWNANIMRLFYIVLACVTYFWPLVIVYLLAWMIIPAAVTAEQVLQMKGEPVNPCTIGQTLAQQPVAGGDGNFFGTFFSILGKIVIGFVGFVAALVGLGALLVFIAMVTALLAFTVSMPGLAFEGFTWPWDPTLTAMQGWAVAIWCLFGAMVCGALIWGGVTALFKVRKASKSVKVTYLILSVVTLIAAIVLTVLASVAF